MTLTGVGCRLQTCSRLASERFDSAFCAPDFGPFMQIIVTGVLQDDCCMHKYNIYFCDSDGLEARGKYQFPFLLAPGKLCAKDFTVNSSRFHHSKPLKTVLSGHPLLSGHQLESLNFLPTFTLSVRRRRHQLQAILLHKTCNKRTFQGLHTSKSSAQT